MMKDLAPDLENLLDKVETLLVKHGKLKAELTKLKESNASLQATQEKREVQIKDLDHRIAVLKTVKQLPVEGEDRTQIRNKVNEYIREIDRCIAMLNN